MISINIEKRLKAYSGCQVLHVQTQAPQGSITKVYGPSGSGKTTFLKTIAGLTVPEKGIIRIAEDTWLDVAANINLSPQKRKCGFVFQNYALFPNMSVLKHLQYATNDHEWIKVLLSLGKLEPFINHKPDHLSGGQQQRLAILRALAIKPAVLLMDEPFSALDLEMKSGLIEELKKVLKQLNTTTFIVSHNPQEMEGWFDQEIYIRDSTPVL